MSNFQYKNIFLQVNVHICISERVHAASIFMCRCRCTSPNTAMRLEIGYVDASMAVLGFWPGAGLDGHEVSGLPGALRGDLRFPFRTVSSSLGLKVRGTKPSASATSTIHNGPGKKQSKHLNLKLHTPEMFDYHVSRIKLVLLLCLFSGGLCYCVNTLFSLNSSKRLLFKTP